MATLMDKYVNSLVKANEARKADIQKQYDAWAKKQSAAQNTVQPVAEMPTAEMQTPVQQEIPVLKSIAPYVNEEAAQRAERAQQISNDFANISNYIANAKAQKEREKQAATQKVVAERQAERDRNSQVVMDENGMVDIDSVKRNARATTAQRQSDWAQKQLAKGNYPQAQYTADGKLDVAALQNDPRVQEMNKVNIGGAPAGKATEKLTSRAQTWLDPSYKMTKEDKKEYKALLEEWKKERGAEGAKMYERAKAFETVDNSFFAGYPELQYMLDIENKLDPTYATSMGGRSVLGGVNALAGSMAKDLGVSDENINKFEEKMERDAENAEKQNFLAYHGGRLGTYAGKLYVESRAAGAAGAALGIAIPVLQPITNLLRQKSVRDAVKGAGSALGKIGAFTKTVAGNTAKDTLLADMFGDTLPEYAYNKYRGLSDEEALERAKQNIIGNAIGNLIGNGVLGPGIEYLTSRGAKEAVSELADQGAKNEIEVLQNAAKASNDVPTRQIAEEVQQATKEADDLAKAADDVNVKPVDEAPVRQAVDETAERATRNIAEEINESKVSALGRNPATGDLSNYGNAIMRRLNELNGVSPARTEALNADPALKEAFDNAWNNYLTEFTKADAGQTNALKAATSDLADVYESVSKVTGENANARKSLEEVYDVLMHRNIPRKFEGDMPEQINPILDMLDEQDASNLTHAVDSVRNSIEETLYRNMKAINADETLRTKVKDVTDAYDKWVDAVYAGIGDTERLGKDVRNAINRANTAFKNHNLSSINADWKAFNLPDMILKQNTPEGYVPPVDNSVISADNIIKEGAENGRLDNTAVETAEAVQRQGSRTNEVLQSDAGRYGEGLDGSGLQRGRGVDEIGGDVRSGNSVVPNGLRLIDNNLRTEMDASGISNMGLKDASSDYPRYSEALDVARKANEHGAFVDSKSVEELTERGARTFLNDEGTAGVAVMNDGNIVGVFKNPVDVRKGAAMDLVLTARNNGGDRLDCYGYNLVGKYMDAGFEPVARVKYEYGINPEMDNYCRMMKSKDANFREPDIYFMKVRDGESLDQTVANYRAGKRNRVKSSELEQLPLMDYEAAEAYRNNLIDNYKRGSNTPGNGSGTAFSDAGKTVGEDIRPDAEMTITPKRNEPQAPKTSVEQNGPETRERSYAKNIREGRVEADEKVRADFEERPREYVVTTNASTRERVDNIVKKGLTHSQEEFAKMRGTNDPAFAPLGQEIARMLSKDGRHYQAADVLDEVSQALTDAGKFTQAAYITMLKDDPMTALSSVQKQIKNINAEGQKKFGKKWNDFSLTEGEIKSITDLKPGDEEGLKSAVDAISARLGADYPTTMLDKLLEARKISMLLHSRTLIRNPLANLPTLGMRWISDRVAAIGERGYKALVNKNYKVTQGLAGSGINGRKLAERVFKSDQVQELIKGTSGKYEVPELGRGIIQNKTMFKGTVVDRFLENAGVDFQGINKKLFGKDNVHSAAETTRNLTYKLLDLGDSPFVKENFVERLGSYINAQGIKNIEDIPQEAIDLAWMEAMKATYKDNSWAVKMVSGLRKALMYGGKPGKAAADALIPFVQAPGNIAARMVDYSALGGANGIKNIIKGTKNADEALVREGIDQLAKGVTGSGLVVAGVALHNAGIITGAYSKDKDQRNFQKQSGYREYALHVGDKYYSYNWAQPAAQPLIIGTLLAEAVNNSDQFDSDMLRYFGAEGSTAGKVIGAMKEGAGASVNSWFNETPMQGLAELFRNKMGGYETDIAGNIWDVAVSDFASSFIPSSVNAFAKSSDPTQRQTTDYDNAFATFVNQQRAKIPGLSDDLPAKYDTWGREMKYGETKADAAFNRFINPGDVGTDKHDPLDDAINKLYEDTKEVSVFPTTAPTSANGHKLTAKEYADYQKDMGKRSHEMADALIKSDLYKNMTNDEKVKALSDIYSASKALTENKLYEKDINNSAAKAYQEGGAKGVVRYFSAKKAINQYGFSDSSRAGETVYGSSNPEKTAKELNEAQNLMKNAGLLDRKETQPPSKVVDIYTENGMKGVRDYVTVEQNTKGGSYNGYQSMKEAIPYLTAKEYADIYNQFSVPSENGNYNDQFSKDTELIPYLTSRGWDSEEQLNIVAHALSPSVEGTWHIDNGRLYYNKPSVEKWER